MELETLKVPVVDMSPATFNVVEVTTAAAFLIWMVSPLLCGLVTPVACRPM